MLPGIVIQLSVTGLTKELAGEVAKLQKELKEAKEVESKLTFQLDQAAASKLM